MFAACWLSDVRCMSSEARQTSELNSQNKSEARAITGFLKEGNAPLVLPNIEAPLVADSHSTNKRWYSKLVAHLDGERVLSDWFLIWSRNAIEGCLGRSPWPPCVYPLYKTWPQDFWVQGIAPQERLHTGALHTQGRYWSYPAKGPSHVAFRKLC